MFSACITTVIADHASEPWKSLGIYMENSMVPLRHGAVAQNASGQVNVKFGAVSNVPSYGKYRVTLYMQLQEQFY